MQSLHNNVYITITASPHRLILICSTPSKFIYVRCMTINLRTDHLNTLMAANEHVLCFHLLSLLSARQIYYFNATGKCFLSSQHWISPIMRPMHSFDCLQTSQISSQVIVLVGCLFGTVGFGRLLTN